ncbi:MAG: phosphoglucosamine mutase [Candidatus Omnitrophota bacterium]
MTNNRLFGTDGIRGTFGHWPLTEELICSLGYALAKWLKRKSKNKKSLWIVIGKDTRASCDDISGYLLNGLNQPNIKVGLAGMVPTPALAFLTQKVRADLGIMISASHNLAADNGIKFFNRDGFKLTGEEEDQIEKLIFSFLRPKKKKSSAAKKYKSRTESIASKHYIRHLKNCVPRLDLTGMKIVVDCANGAVSPFAQKLFADLGADTSALHNCPDGLNINLNCGSLHPEHAGVYVKRKKADIGFSFDGDGDRVILADKCGRIYHGDHIMALIAKHFLKSGRLKNKTLVATSMSNFGLDKFLHNIGVRLVRADVGDKFVLKKILEKKGNFGGEQSGHIIFLDHAKTGDGMLTALMVLDVLRESGKSIAELIKGFKEYPQLIRNVKVKEKRDFKKMPDVRKKVQAAETALKNRGRLVLRYSGTENLARIMVEGDNTRKIKRIAESIAKAIEKEIGI